MSARDPGPRLGRGLAALLGEAPSATAQHGPRALPVTSLTPSEFQPRRDMRPEQLAELADSIRQQGVLQPILARPHPAEPDRYQIIAGERRWRASQIAGRHEIPALIRELTDAEAMAAALVENLQRQDLNAIEEADGYRRLLEEFGLTQEKLGEAVGKSRSHVANMMRLLQLPPELRSLLQDGQISAGHARALLGHPDPVRAARQVVARGLNVRQTESLARPATAARATMRSAAPGKDANLRALEHDLSEHLGLALEIMPAGPGGQVRIVYRTLDQLDGLLALLRSEPQ